MLRRVLSALPIFAAGALAGAALCAVFDVQPAVSAAPADVPPPTIESLAAEMESIKGRLPDQAHVMQDAGYHFSNLWFAGQRENWALAQFYWAETRSHLRWAVRIIPKRKDSAGQEIDLEAILQAFETTSLKLIEDAVAAKDKPKFDAAYRTALEGCYSCHKASDKPFLRPQIPTQPETPIINFDPRATWPK